MSRFVLAGAGAIVLLLMAGWWIKDSSGSSEIVFETRTSPTRMAPLCPWREPEADMRRFFPEATRHETETRILSGRRLELAGRLGRPPMPEENALHLHRVFRDRESLGTILVRRVKGEHGAIELVLAVSPAGCVAGVRLQRLREPEPIAAALQQPDWLATFRGKSAQDAYLADRDVPEVSGDARASARAIAEGVRSLLVLLGVASGPDAVARSHH